MKQSLYEYALENKLKYHIETYGCQMNEHDSEKIAGLLQAVGYQRAEQMQQADLILFNTCCVRDHAEKKVFGNIGALKPLSQQKSGLIVAVCGCMMQQEEVAKKLMQTFPFVKIVFGTNNMNELPSMLYRAVMHRERVFNVQKANISSTAIEDVPMVRKKCPLATVNIMQGCDNFCTYCIVPYVRGREWSRPAGDILMEVRGLVEQGYREVMLLGQNVNSYGKKGGETSMDFADLLEQIAASTGISRIRFMTSHPKDISKKLLEKIAGHENICKQLHLPVQSGSSRVLMRMNRGYTREEYLRLVETAREIVPGIALTTDIIVGFPGESEEDYAQTLSLVREVGYDAAFTFVYSPRKGTKAAEFPEQVPEQIKQQRIVKLIELQSELTYKSNLRYVGKKELILVEDVSKKDEQSICGRTDSGKMVNFKGPKEKIGSFVSVEILEAKRTTLLGRMLDA